MDISFLCSFLECLNIPFYILTNDIPEDPHKVFFAKTGK